MSPDAISTNSRIIVALDYSSASDALAFVEQVKPEQCRLKVGFELFLAAGPAIVEGLVDKGFDVFLDLKLHDIPNTVARSCSVAASLGVWMLNVHTLGGRPMMEAAKNAIVKSATRPLLIGVTVLTSHSRQELAEIGLDQDPAQQVLALAKLASASGLDGVVCSASEANLLRQTIDEPFCLVTPGIRPVGSEAADQKRIMTPVEAVRAGASYLVIGRPITAAKDPFSMLASINSELAECNRA